MDRVTKFRFSVTGTGDGTASVILSGASGPDHDVALSRADWVKDSKIQAANWEIRAIAMGAATGITGIRACILDSFKRPLEDYANDFSTMPQVFQALRVDDGSRGFVAVTADAVEPLIDSGVENPRIAAGSAVLFVDILAAGAWTLEGYVEASLVK